MPSVYDKSQTTVSLAFPVFCVPRPFRNTVILRASANPPVPGSKVMKKPEARIEPYTHPAAGWGALKYVAINLIKEKVTAGNYRTLLAQNQPDGFDCPGCAWPDREHASTFEFCENGVKAVAAEATSEARDAGVLRGAHGCRTDDAIRLRARTAARPPDRPAGLRRDPTTATCRSNGTMPSN